MFISSLFVLSAHAYIFVGNPEAGVRLEVPGASLTYADADVDFIRVHQCGGGYTQFEVDAAVDLVAGFTVDIDPGNLCGVSVKWASDVDFGGSGFDATYSEGHTSVTLGGSPSTVWTGLTPFTVVSGDLPAMPRLVVRVE